MAGSMAGSMVGSIVGLIVGLMDGLIVGLMVGLMPGSMVGPISAESAATGESAIHVGAALLPRMVLTWLWLLAWSAGSVAAGVPLLQSRQECRSHKGVLSPQSRQECCSHEGVLPSPELLPPSGIDTPSEKK